MLQQNEAARLAQVHVDDLHFLQGKFFGIAHARMIGTCTLAPMFGFMT